MEGEVDFISYWFFLFVYLFSFVLFLRSPSLLSLPPSSFSLSALLIPYFASLTPLCIRHLGRFVFKIRIQRKVSHKVCKTELGLPLAKITLFLSFSVLKTFSIKENSSYLQVYSSFFSFSLQKQNGAMAFFLFFFLFLLFQFYVILSK